MSQPKLTIVAGAGQRHSPWLELPATVLAKSHVDPARACHYRVSGGDAIRSASSGLKQPVFYFWSMVIGEPPPVPHMSDTGVGLTRLDQAHACFSGLKRPLGSDDNGGSFAVYILKPQFLYQQQSLNQPFHQQSPQYMAKS